MDEELLPEEYGKKIGTDELFFGFIIFFIIAALITAVVDILNVNTLFVLNLPGEGAKSLNFLDLVDLFNASNYIISPPCFITYCGLFAILNCSLLIGAAVLVKKRSRNFVSLFFAAFILTAIQDTAVSLFSSVPVYTVFRFAIGFIPMGIWCLCLLRSPKLRDGFENPLLSAEPPLQFGGWVLGIAFLLLPLVLSSIWDFLNSAASCAYLIFSPQYMEGMTLTSVLIPLIYSILAVPLSIVSAISFFRRQKSFKPLMIALFSVVILCDIAMAVTNATQQKAQNPDVRLRMYIFMSIIPDMPRILMDLSGILYLCFSRRVRKTFVYAEKSGDPLCQSYRKLPSDTGVLPVWGWAILSSVLIATIISSSYNGLFRSFSNISSPATSILYLLQCVLQLALSIWCFVLFFRRKKLFRWMFIALIGLYFVCRIPSLMKDVAILASTVGVVILVGIGFIFYVIFSKRVKRTFIYDTSFSSLKGFFSRVRQGLTPPAEENYPKDHE